MDNHFIIGHGMPLSILAIGSHPDDIEFGCGATMYKCAQDGHNVYFLVMTDGGAGGDPDIRKDEQIHSAKLLGVKKLYWGNCLDTKLPSLDETIQIIQNIVEEVCPSYVFVHFGNDTHQDHRQLSVCTISATRKIPNVLYYEGPTTIDFRPNIYVDIQSYLEPKLKLLTCHESQLTRTHVKQQSILEIAHAVAIFRGIQCRVAYAEAFTSLRLFL
ncbi:MAG: PIG-L family deacetylase [Chitinivibrionales bacterium]|nr:PIG-L family deacetylase [Chitinivibrionales bacterium]